MKRFAGVRRVVGLIGLVAVAAACDDESQLADGPDERVGEASAAICRSVELTATRTYNPDEVVPDLQLLDPPMTFGLPENLQISAGGAELGDFAGFVFVSSALPDQVKCFYLADSPSNYSFDYCRWESSGAVVSFTQMPDVWAVLLTVGEGDSSLGPTVISVTLPELTPCDGVDCSVATIDDDNACTVDTCTDEEGIKHTPVELVEDNDPGTIEVCFPATGIETRTAPELPGGTTTVVDAWSFLYNDTNPLQAGVGLDAIDTVRAALIEGYVFKPDGNPKPNANVSILGHPELGSTITDFGGRYLMVVNGGGPMTLDIQADGYLPVQRRADPPWHGKARVDDVVLVDPGQPDGAADIDVDGIQVITDTTIETDLRGDRQLKVIVQPWTTASMEVDGNLVPLEDTLTLTIKEYTVGEEGPMRMPAALPESSAYTYAVEIRAEEAEAAGATGVVLDTPLHVYLDNFLEFPVGTVVPAGRYDRQRGVWVPEEDGLVIGIVAVDGFGAATLDLDGDGLAEPNPEDFGFDFDTRVQLAVDYGAPKTLWHVRLGHLTPHDFNWAISDSACSPAECGPEPEFPDDDPNDCEVSGSRIECSNQVLGESFPVNGTPFSLAYSSARVPGRARPQRRVSLPLTGDAPPSDLRSVEAQVDVAGRTFTTELVCPPTGCDPNEVWAFEDWDGRDLMGRMVQGAQRAVFKISYVYDRLYVTPEVVAGVAEGVLITPAFAFARWGEDGGVSIGGTNAVPTVRVTSKWDFKLGGFDARSEGLGGFTFDAVHYFDVHTSTLYLGDGHRRIVEPNRLVVREIDQPPAGAYAIKDLVAEPSGSVVGVVGSNQVYRRESNGAETPLTGGSLCPTNCPAHDVTSIAVGPDGSIYLAESILPRVQRLGPDGLSNFAGNGTAASTGDGGPAAAAQIRPPMAVAVAPDGSVYIATSGAPSTIRRVDVNGNIDTVAGQNNSSVAFPPGGQASEMWLGQVDDMEFGLDGSLYVLSTAGSTGYIQRVDPDGSVVRVAGVGSSGGGTGDEGIPAVDAFIDRPTRFALHPDGTIDVICDLGERVRRITSDGTIRTIAGTLHGFVQGLDKRLGGPAGYAQFSALSAIARMPDGRIFLGEQNPGSLLSVEPSLPGLSNDLTQQIASEDGREVYVFDQVGRHLWTQDALFGTVTLDIERDSAGRILTLTDENNRVTTVLRDGNGDPTSITGPYGHVTDLILDSDGYLQTAEDPRGDAYQMDYDDDGNGLMTSWTNRNGHSTAFTWDEDGRLFQHTNEQGGITTLSEIATTSGTKIQRETPLHRFTTYERAENAAGVVERKSTSPNLLVATSARTPAGETVTVRPDGTEITTQLGGDPRFAMQAPFVAYQKERLPSSLERVVQRSRTVTLSDPNDWFSVLTSTETTTINPPALPATSVPWTTVYTKSGSTWTEVTTSPEGRETARTFDELGRLISVSRPDIAPIFFEYDANGRLETTTHATRVTTRAYSPTSGLLWKIFDPLEQATILGRNARGDVTSETRGGLVTLFDYDGEQHTSSVTPPEQPLQTHSLAYGPFDKLEEYHPPSLGNPPNQWATVYAYDDDKNIESILQPGPRLVSYGYDTAGRLETVVFPGGEIDRGYDPTTGQLNLLEGPYGVRLALTHDGRLLTQARWSKDVEGLIDFAYDDYFRLETETVSGASSTGFAYDDDGLVVQAGSIIIDRDNPIGRVDSKSSGSVVEEFAYDPDYGELSSIEATFGATSLFSQSYVRDDLGRITQKTETIDGTTHDYDYVYDSSGRLDTVEQDGVPLAEDYGYDDNGNRTSSSNAAGSFTATFDAQDRIETYGPLTFTWTDNGEIAERYDSDTKESSIYTYDALGNLIAVELPNGDLIEYLVDGLGRRVGKKVNGVLEKQWLWRSQLQPVAELDGAGNLVAQYVYTDGVNVPDQAIIGGGVYRLIKDHLGSVRMVVKEGTGAVQETVTYDSWGRIVDGGITMVPFGFAGGLYDADTGLVRFGARDYDPEIGRWTSKDPIRFDGGVNLYAYVGDDPVNRIDPTGRMFIDPGPLQDPMGPAVDKFIDDLLPPGGMCEMPPEDPPGAPEPSRKCELTGDGFPHPDGGMICRCSCDDGATCDNFVLGNECSAGSACSCDQN